MTVKVLYFAGLRETLGVSAEDFGLSEATTVAALRERLASRGEPWGALARTKNLRSAVNQVMASAETPVADGDEVAFFPPVTGG